MKQNQFGIAVIGLVLFGVGAVGLAADKVDLGKREYDTNCAVCHGATGKGDGPFASVMNVRTPSLTALAKANGGVFPFARVYEIIEGAQVPKAHGVSGMMIWGDAYVTQRAGLKDDYGGALYDPATLARARTLALTEYTYRLQEK
jgi:mono/diheme cytochrome c family protein